MENLLPIVLGIIFLAFQQYRKSMKNKNKPAYPENNPTNTPYNPPKREQTEQKIEDFMNTLFGETEVSPSAQTTYQFEEELQEKEESIEDNEPLENEDSSVKRSAYTKLKGRINKSTNTYQNKRALTSKNTDFELRRAIIYDAILNPPYIKI